MLMTVNQHLYTETGYPEYPKITHEEAVAKRAQRVISIVDGKIVKDTKKK